MAEELKGTVFCNVPGCTSYRHAQRLCTNHYRSFREQGILGGVACSEEACEKTASVRGYCRKHYGMHKRNGTLPEKDKEVTGVCPGDGEGDVCWGVVKARGLCNTHYVKWYRNKKKEVRK